MAVKFDIQVGNGTVTITVGGQSSSSPGSKKQTRRGSGSGGAGPEASVGSGGAGPEASVGTGGAGAGSNCCCAPLIIGPIVISGGILGAGSVGGAGPEAGLGTGGAGPEAGLGTGGAGPEAGLGTGGGEAGVGNGCCSPVVIGPIVITDGCSGQGAQSGESGSTGSRAVTVNPPIQPKKPSPGGTFIMQTQKASNWCWAAVAVSINDFLDPPTPLAAPTWTQPTLANELLGIAAPGCIAAPAIRRCNKPEALDQALTITENLMPDGYLSNQHLTFESIQEWVNVEFPIGLRITWRGSGAHFIVAVGFKAPPSGRQIVLVQDPSPYASPGIWDYDELVNNYDDAGFWSDTYLVQV